MPEVLTAVWIAADSCCWAEDIPKIYWKRMIA